MFVERVIIRLIYKVNRSITPTTYDSTYSHPTTSTSAHSVIPTSTTFSNTNGTGTILLHILLILLSITVVINTAHVVVPEIDHR